MNIFEKRAIPKQEEEGNNVVLNKVKEYHKTYRLNNKEKLKTYNQNYYKQNREKIKQVKKKWSNNNKQKISEAKKVYYKKNKTKILQKVKCSGCGKTMNRSSLYKHKKICKSK